jgi:ADP-sugar diphosphatase
MIRIYLILFLITIKTMNNFIFNPTIELNVQNAVLDMASKSQSKLAKWLNTCESNNIKIKSIYIDAVTMFGPTPGFIYLTADASNSTGDKLPGTVLIRGDAVCCLLIIKNSDTNEHFMVGVEEIKVPVGKSIIQTPAGMMDSSNNFKGKIIDEIKEETGITISNDLVQFTDIHRLQPNKLIQFDGFYPSQGGCDEYIHVYAYYVEMNTEQLSSIDNKLLGNVYEHEMIKVKILQLKWSVIDGICDSKMLVAASKFDRKFPGIILP